MRGILGAATLGLGTAALLARNDLDGKGGLAAAYGLGLYNVLAACFILWTAVGLGGAALWSAGLIHAAIGALFVYAVCASRLSNDADPHPAYARQFWLRAAPDLPRGR